MGSAESRDAPGGREHGFPPKRGEGGAERRRGGSGADSAGPARAERPPAGSATLALLAAAGVALAAGPARAGSGTVIAGDTVWEGEVTVSGPVTVEKGATLRIRPGTRVLLSGEDLDGDGCRDGYVQIFGRLFVEGEKGRPVRFAALAPGSPWKEIFLKDAEGVIRHAEFSGALWGLHVHDGHVRVEHAAFRGNGGGARLKGTGASFSRCTFRDNGVALRFWDGGPTVVDSVIEGNGVGLFYREGRGGGRFRGNRLGNREWNLKVGDWAVGDLDVSENYWTPAAGGQVSLVKDYREKKTPGRVRLAPALAEPPPVCGADEGREASR
ncbi:MAG: hypothetical protein ACM3NF_05500 [Gemmatimonadota bacterium]